MPNLSVPDLVLTVLFFLTAAAAVFWFYDPHLAAVSGFLCGIYSMRSATLSRRRKER